MGHSAKNDRWVDEFYRFKDIFTLQSMERLAKIESAAGIMIFEG